MDNIKYVKLNQNALIVVIHFFIKTIHKTYQTSGFLLYYQALALSRVIHFQAA